MHRFFLLWLGICLALLDPEGAVAAATGSTSAAIASTELRDIPRPRYKRYRHRAKTRRAKRKARREKRNRGLFRKRPKGVITVDPPVRNQ